MDVEADEPAPDGGGDAGESLPHDVQRIFRGEQQAPAGLRRRKPAQARHAAGDRDGHVQGEKRLAGSASIGVVAGSVRLATRGLQTARKLDRLRSIGRIVA